MLLRKPIILKLPPACMIPLPTVRTMVTCCLQRTLASHILVHIKCCFELIETANYHREVITSQSGSANSALALCALPQIPELNVIVSLERIASFSRCTFQPLTSSIDFSIASSCMVQQQQQ